MGMLFQDWLEKDHEILIPTLASFLRGFADPVFW
jgi:hypothetical protein